ncbi:MAG: GH25 family lysozyme [Crocinitomicaceae bacterium]|nr:GH25 family lysozyme [Crocinitomicaceae bacterium]
MLVAVIVYRYTGNNSPKFELVNLPELPEGFYSYGIDISHHQGEIDWDTFFHSTDSIITFVYCKATEGLNHVDSQYETNRDELLEHGMPHGAYHFFLPNKDGLQQAKHFLTIYSPTQNDLPPVLDAEVEGSSDAEIIERMKIWLTHVEEETGKRPLIYTSYNFYKDIFKGKFPGYKFWIANYNTIASRFEDEEIIHWQFSDNGEMPGISGPVDLNYSKIAFE